MLCRNRSAGRTHVFRKSDSNLSWRETKRGLDIDASSPVMPVFSPTTPGLVRHTQTVAALGAGMFVLGVFGVYKGYQWVTSKPSLQVQQKQCRED
jgi:hypothetical protein